MPIPPQGFDPSPSQPPAEVLSPLWGLPLDVEGHAVNSFTITDVSPPPGPYTAQDGHPEDALTVPFTPPTHPADEAQA